jgi:serine phosphatase RsbU (regulator of sigma subunit)
MSTLWASLIRKLMIVIAGITLLVGLGVYFGLSRHERDTLVSGKVGTATTVLRYLASSLGPEIAFADDKSISQDLQNLLPSGDVLNVAVYADDHGSLHLVSAVVAQGSKRAATSPEGTDEAVTLHDDYFEVQTPVADGGGGRVGVVRAAFSLAAVNATITANTRRTLWTCALVGFGAAVVLLAAIGQSLLRPMREMRMARELEIAAHIQRALLPSKPLHPAFDFAGRMIPANEVGGDFFDVQSSDRALWITIGDVSGHGLPAGLVMLMAQSAFASHFRATPDAEPQRVFRAVNELLWQNVSKRLRDDKYATCQLLAYRGSGRFAVVGGHQALLVYRASTGQVETVEAPGPWLGILRELPAFATHDLQLDVDDVLCLYSDGLIEAPDKRGDLYDLPRLRAKLGDALGATRDLDAAVERVLQDVLGFCDRLEDDGCLLLVRRKAEAVGSSA